MKCEFNVKRKYLYGILALICNGLSAVLFAAAFFAAADVALLFTMIGGCVLSGAAGLLLCRFQRGKCWFYAVELGKKFQIVLLFSLFVLLAVFMPLAIIL